MPSDILAKTKDYWFFERWAHECLPGWVKEVNEELADLHRKDGEKEEEIKQLKEEIKRLKGE